MVDEKELIPEIFPLKKERKGGVANLIFAALLLEAARMKDEGLNLNDIEAASQEAFAISEGYLTQIENIGAPVVYEFLASLSSKLDSAHPLKGRYDNFFTPPGSLEKKDSLIAPGRGEDTADLMLLDILKNRFLAVAFMVSVEVVEAGLLKLQDMDTLCKQTFKWKEGPFAQMNRLGLEEVMRIVTEKMEISHRREINFPVPRMLISQVQKNVPWPLNSGAA